jgi:hypothetical protein
MPNIVQRVQHKSFPRQVKLSKKYELCPNEEQKNMTERAKSKKDAPHLG